jgi:hypothetical protein
MIRCIGTHQRQANLRVLEVTEIKTVPYVLLSHPFLERLIGTVRRKYLDRLLFWTTTDLETKLLDFPNGQTVQQSGRLRRVKLRSTSPIFSTIRASERD